MADIEQMLKKIEGKLRMLQFTRDETPRIRDKNDLKSLERHQNVFGELIDNIHEEKVQLARIEKGDESDEVKQWTLARQDWHWASSQVFLFKRASGFKSTIVCGWSFFHP